MLDPIPLKVLKEVLPEVIDPLLAIINSSLSLGYVSTTFKLAVIKPLLLNYYLGLCINNQSQKNFFYHFFLLGLWRIHKLSIFAFGLHNCFYNLRSLTDFGQNKKKINGS